MLKICAVARLIADPGIWIWFRIRGVDDQTKIRRKNIDIDKFKVKKGGRRNKDGCIQHKR